jgi:hypothetical protein
MFAVHALPVAAAPAARAQQPGTGSIQGAARSASGQPLPNYTVQIRNIQTGQLAGSTTSNAAGNFTFTGLNPANYVIEIVNPAGTIVGTSAAITVAAGATVTVTVPATAAAAIAGATTTAGAAAAGAGGAAAGISTAVLITTIAAGAGVAAIIVAATQGEASPSR